MVDCMECTNFLNCHYSGQLTGRLTSCPDFKQKPQTRADRIRSMSDEELAEFLDTIGCPPENQRNCFEISCKHCWEKCLKQPAEV